MKVMFLTRGDVQKVISMREVIEYVEKAFKAKGLGKVQMPPKIYVNFPNGDFRAMPCYIPEFGFGGVKIVNVHPLNPEKYNLPTVMATILLIDPETGKPLAIMEGGLITDMRTGAAGGIAAKYLARKDSKVVGMVGAGAQAKTQLLALNEVMDVEEVKICAKTSSECRKFIKDMSYLGLDIYEKKIDDVVKNSDILVTATPVTKPIVKDEWVGEGMHINAIGADAPGKQELDPNILKRAKIFVDDYEQACHSGEVNVPLAKGIIKKEDICGELSDVIVGKKKGRVDDTDITIFDSTGLAIQDLATAVLVYEKAKKLDLGNEIPFFAQ